MSRAPFFPLRGLMESGTVHPYCICTDPYYPTVSGLYSATAAAERVFCNGKARLAACLGKGYPGLYSPV